MSQDKGLDVFLSFLHSFRVVSLPCTFSWLQHSSFIFLGSFPVDYVAIVALLLRGDRKPGRGWSGETYPSGTSNEVSEMRFGESGEFLFPRVHIFALEKGLGMIHNYFSLFPWRPLKELSPIITMGTWQGFPQDWPMGVSYFPTRLLLPVQVNRVPLLGLYGYTCLSGIQGGSLPCKLISLVGIRKVRIFQFVQLFLVVIMGRTTFQSFACCWNQKSQAVFQTD